MSIAPPGFLCDPVLIDLGIEHGFGQRGSQPPEKTVFPVQIHENDVFHVTSPDSGDRPPADVVITAVPGLPVGIVTADCVPILVAAEDGSAVAAIHAGWRGLAKGVIEAGLREIAVAAKGANLVAAVGPAGRGCCYEVDNPVRSALEENYSDGLEEALEIGRPGHFRLDLPRLATWLLAKNGVESHRIGIQHRVCTICNDDRFESYRREGVMAGRLAHFIIRPTTDQAQPRARVDSFKGCP